MPDIDNCNIIPSLFSFNDFAMLRRTVYAEHDETIVREYLSVFSEPGALTSALNWYRAPNALAGTGSMEVDIPTAFIWGNQDPVVGQQALSAQRDFFANNLWETELNTGHWLMETEAQAVTAAVLEHLERVTGYQEEG